MGLLYPGPARFFKDEMEQSGVIVIPGHIYYYFDKLLIFLQLLRLSIDKKESSLMRITTRGRYALRATLALAKLGKDGSPVSISTLSEQENISSVFLEQIFFKLRKAGIVDSVRGPGGGFCFALPLERLTIKQILDAAGEDLELIFCDKTIDNCDRIGSCLAHDVWTDVTHLINTYFTSKTLAALLDRDASRATAPGIEEFINETTGA
jgi:Rrf2 family iron-sulfur cluster assembly transcriptional regulator